MKYRFIAACPRCRKTREVEFRRPEKPCLSCGDRLMDNIEISVTRVQRWPIPSDTERDDRDSEKLIAAFDRATQRLRSDYERDEIDTAKQLSGLDAAIEELRMANRPPPRSLSDAQWDDIDSQKQIETFRSKRKRNQSDPASQGQTQRWPIITDTERDLRDGEKLIAAFDRSIKRDQERQSQQSSQTSPKPPLTPTKET